MGWDERAISDFIVAMQNGDQNALEMFYSFAGPMRDVLLNTTGNAGNQLNDRLTPFLDQGESLWRGMPDLFRDAGGLYMTPEMQQILGNQGGVAEQAGGLAGLAGQGFAGGGWTPQYQQGFDIAAPYMQGWGNNAQQALGDVGPNLIGQRGQTAFTQGMQDRGMDAANSGGQNEWLTNALNFAQQELAGRGGDTFTQGLQQQGLGMATKDPLLSENELVNWAREDASNQVRNQAEKTYRQVQQRGGGPGGTSGVQNEGYADFSEAAAQLMAENARKALMERQGLGLQQQGMGGDFIGTGGGLETQRTGQAYGAVPGTQSAATNFLEAMLQGGLGAGQLENSRMQTGAGMSESLLNNQLGFGNLNNQMMGNQNQYALGLGGLSNAAMNTQGNQMQNQFGNYLGSGTLGVNRAGQMADSMNTGFSNMAGMFGQGNTLFNNSLNSMGQLAGNANARGNQFLQGWATPYAGMYSPTGAWSQLANTALTAAGNAAGPVAQAMSERDLKENIVSVGKENDHNIYEFNYKGNRQRFVGVMADEVEIKAPEAIVPTPFGRMVNYEKIGVAFRAING